MQVACQQSSDFFPFLIDVQADRPYTLYMTKQLASAALLTLILSGCQVVDVLDGQVDDPDTCCLKVGESAVRSCLAQFEVADECWLFECSGPLPDMHVPEGCDLED